MSVLHALPAEPLDRDEIERLRAHEDVTTLTAIGTTTARARPQDRVRVTTSVVVLADGIVYALEYEDAGWSREILETDADRRDHLERALDYVAR